MAKMVNFGVAYGMSDFGLAERLHIDRETAGQFINDYFAAYEGIRRYTIEIRIMARDQGYVDDPPRPAALPARAVARNSALRAAGERMAINMPIQGTAADGIKIAMVRLDAAMRERDLHSRMLLQVHDELVFETDADERDELATLAATTMEAALPLDVPLTVDLKVGTDWDRMDRLARPTATQLPGRRGRPRRGARGGPGGGPRRRLSRWA